MGHYYQILMPLLSLFLVRVDLTDLFPLTMKVELLKIYDGDTVLVRHGTYRMKLRFSKIDSPENGQLFIGTKIDAGLVAKTCLEKVLMREGELTLRIEKKDIYGRILGDVNNVSLKLIEQGCTTLYPYAVFESRGEKTIFLKALKKAKASRRGLWQYGGFVSPKMYRKISKRGGYRR